MKIYRVSKYCGQEGHQGYEYHSNKKDAEKSQKEFNSWYPNDVLEGVEEFNYPITKKGMLEALNFFGSHANNG